MLAQTGYSSSWGKGGYFIVYLSNSAVIALGEPIDKLLRIDKGNIWRLTSLSEWVEAEFVPLHFLPPLSELVRLNIFPPPPSLKILCHLCTITIHAPQKFILIRV